MGQVVFVLCSGSMATARRPQSKRICIVSLQHFGGRSRDHRLGAGCTGTRRTGPCGCSRLAPAPHPDPGRPWMLLDFGSEANCISRATGPVSPSSHLSIPGCLGAPVWRRHAQCRQVRPGQAPPAAFVLLPCTGWHGHPLPFVPEGPQQRSPGPGLASGAWLRAAGIALPAAGSCLQPAPCRLALCLGLPALLHQRQTRASPSPCQSGARLALGRIPGLSSPGSSPAGAAGEGP